MRRSKFIGSFLFAGCAVLPFAIAPAIAASSGDEKLKWDVSAPPGMKVHQVTIDVTEGSWMNLDVSPDGKTIAFDLLGDIYTMSISGGIPKRIAEGLPYETQPRFSPDGKRIAFTSDRGGGDNIWIMNADGSDKRQVTKEDFRLLNQPSWSPDGRFIVAKKHFTTGRSLGTGEVWLYHVSGGNATRYGIFSLFYGLHGSYWMPVLDENAPPVLLTTLAAQGYDLHAFSGPSLSSPEFRSTVFVAMEPQVDDSYPQKAKWERDEYLVQRFQAWNGARRASRWPTPARG